MNSELKNELNSYSDARIINTLKSQEFYDKETVEFAKEIALERNLLDDDQLKNIDEFVVKERLKRDREEKNKLSSGTTIGIGTVLLILFMIIKFILRSMSS